MYQIYVLFIRKIRVFLAFYRDTWPETPPDIPSTNTQHEVKQAMPLRHTDVSAKYTLDLNGTPVVRHVN